MIVLPHTPPTPGVANGGGSPELLSARLNLSCLTGKKEGLAATIHNLEEYLNQVLETTTPDTRAQLFLSRDSIPWTGFVRRRVEWSLHDDLMATVIATALSYLGLASNVISDLVVCDYSSESNDKWKHVIELYKKLVGLCEFGLSLQNNQTKLDPQQWDFLGRLGELCIQLTIVAKLGWLSRNGMLQSNHGALSRVSIYAVGELRTSQLVVEQIARSEKLTLDVKGWRSYLNVMEHYMSGYAALFLARELHQQNKLGEAIGLVNFGLVALQTRKGVTSKDKKHIFVKLREKMDSRHHQNILKQFSSVLSLVIDDTIFSGEGGALALDLAFLFELLNLLHLTLTSENNTLKFDTIVEWQNISTGSQWPLGSKIPVSDIPCYQPRSMSHGDTKASLDAYY